MPSTLPVRCACGALQGRVGAGAAASNRAVCHCDDCQAYAYYLGRAADVLDAEGGTEVIQMSAARLELDDVRHLACVRLTPKGLFRWYAACCMTPLANTLPTRQLPFVGLFRAAVDVGDERALEQAFGAVRGHVFARFADPRPRGKDVYDRPPVRMVLRVARMIAVARLRGEHGRSPFFEARTGEPRAVPRALSEDELRAAESARDARGRGAA